MLSSRGCNGADNSWTRAGTVEVGVKLGSLARLGDGLPLRLLLAGLGGCLVFLAFPPFDLAPLAWLALVPSLWAMRGRERWPAFWLGWLAGSVTNLGGFHWICTLLMNFGHMHWLPAAALTLLLAVYQGLRFALAWWLLAWLRRQRPVRLWWALPLCYLPVEYLLPFIFPWYYANSQYWVIPFVQVTELGGVSLLGLLLLMVNGALYDLLEGLVTARRLLRRALLVALLVPALAAAYGLVRMHQVDARMAAAPQLKVGMVEADVGIWEKEDPRKVDDNLVRHQRMSVELERQGVDLVVWPETSFHAPVVYARRRGEREVKRYRHIPRDVDWLPPAAGPVPEHAAEDRRAGVSLRQRVAPQRGFATPLLFGALTVLPNPANDSPRHPGLDVFNSALLLDGRGRVLGATDKVYLLMFGETVPLGHRFPAFYEWFPEAGDLTAGERMQLLPFRGHRLGVMICYEDILPRFTLRVAPQKPNLLVNLTNDAWFGKTAEPYLHLALAVFRTVENRLALVRSTNTGVSCFVDANGRILKQTSLDGAETLVETVPLLEGTTPYQVLGDWPAWGCILFWPVWLLLRWRRKKRKKRGRS